MRRALGLAAIAAMLIGILAVTAPPADAQQTIDVDPPSGPVGTVVTVTGENFYSPCQVTFDGELVASEKDGTCSIVGSKLTAQFSVPNRPPGTYEVVACACSQQPSEAAAPFTITQTPPPTTSPPTTPPPTTSPPTTSAPTTTLPPTTTTVDGTTTTTLGTVPVSLITGSAVPDLGPGSEFSDLIGDSWRPFTWVGTRFDFPSTWLLRCGPPPQAEWVGFDDTPVDQFVTRLTAVGDEDSVSVSRGSPTVVAPSQGTSTAPHALELDVRPSPSTFYDENVPRFFSDSRFTYFGLRVGLAEDVSGPVVVELAARRFPATWSDVDRVELGPGRSPATTCLMVQPPEGETLREAHLRVYSASGEPVRLIVDDVYWSHTDRYPVEPLPDIVDMEIIYPTPAVRLITARNTGVVGRMTWPAGIPLSEVAVASPNWDGSEVVVRRASVGRVTTEGLVNTAFFWVEDVEVPPGRFEMSATARGPNLRGGITVEFEGHGLPRPPNDEYRDLIEGQVDVIPLAIEVTQAVRGPLERQTPGSSTVDDFRHVAGKRTAVRAYAYHQIPDSLGIRAVQLFGDAVLHGTRGGVALPFSPLRPESGPTRMWGFRPDESQIRPFAGNSFNFILPYTWTTGEPIDLRLEVNPPGSALHIAERSGAGGWLNTITQRVSFTDVGRVGVHAVLVDFFWRCTDEMVESDDEAHPCFGGSIGDVVSSTNTEDQVRTAARGWWRTMPAPGDFPSYLTFSRVQVPHRDDSPRVEVDRSVTGPASIAGWSRWVNAYWDLYCGDSTPSDPTIIRPPSVRDFVWMTQPPYAPLRGGGCAWVNRRSAFRANTWWSTSAQEAGHTAGMEHAGTAHGELSGGGAVIRFPGDHGQIGLPGEEAYGFDPDTMAVITGTGHAHDYMSYGGGTKWTSVGTWDHMFRALSENRTFGEGRGTVMSGSDGGELSGAPGDGPALIVEGVIDGNGVVSLSTPYLGDSNAIFFPDGDDVSLTLVDPAGVTTTFTAGLTGGGSHHAPDYQTFSFALPPDAEAVTITVEVEGSDPVELTSTSGGPALDIVETSPGQFRWDPGAAEPPFLVEASNDGGATWWQLGVTESSELTYDTTLTPLVGAGWTVRVQGADGPRVLFDELPFDFGIPPPVASIGLPLDGARVPVGVTHVHAAVAVIGEDHAEYRWSVDGHQVNEGSVADVPILPGPNQVTLTVENSSGIDQHTIMVIGVIDTDGDGLDDEWEQEHGFDHLAADEVEADPDEDGLSIAQEYQAGTDPHSADTDGDGYLDGHELQGAGDPLDARIGPGPIHGLEDHALAAEPGGVPAAGIPPWVIVAIGAGLLVPAAYWLGRRRAGRRGR